MALMPACLPIPALARLGLTLLHLPVPLPALQYFFSSGALPGDYWSGISRADAASVWTNPLGSVVPDTPSNARPYAHWTRQHQAATADNHNCVLHSYEQRYDAYLGGCLRPRQCCPLEMSGDPADPLHLRQPPECPWSVPPRPHEQAARPCRRRHARPAVCRAVLRLGSVQVCQVWLDRLLLLWHGVLHLRDRPGPVPAAPAAAAARQPAAAALPAKPPNATDL